MTGSTSKYLALASVLALCACTQKEASSRKPADSGVATTPASTTSTTRTETATGTTGATNESTRGTQDESAKMFQSIHQIHTMEIAAGKLATERAMSPKVREYGTKLIRDHQEADQRLQKLATDRGVSLETAQMGQGMDSSSHSTGMDSSSRSSGTGSTTASGSQTKTGSGSMGTTGTSTGSGSMGSGTSTGSGSMGAGTSTGTSQDSTMMTSSQDPAMKESMAAMEKLKTLKGKEFDTAFMQQMVKDHESALAMVEGFRSRTQEPAFQQEAQTLLIAIRAHRDAAQTIVSSLSGATDRKDVRGTETKSNGGSAMPTATPSAPQHH